jgi:hypothetical protein
MAAKDAQKRECDARCGTEMREGEAVKWGIILKSTLRYRNPLVLTPRCRRDFNPVAVSTDVLRVFNVFVICNYYYLNNNKPFPLNF